jgi:hypothetical protein
MTRAAIAMRGKRLPARLIWGFDTTPFLQPAENNLDPVVASVSTLVVSGRIFAVLPAKCTGTYPLCPA